MLTATERRPRTIKEWTFHADGEYQKVDQNYLSHQMSESQILYQQNLIALFIRLFIF